MGWPCTGHKRVNLCKAFRLSLGDATRLQQMLTFRKAVSESIHRGRRFVNIARSGARVRIRVPSGLVFLYNAKRAWPAPGLRPWQAGID